MPAARAGDPQTSHDAAASVTKLRPRQQGVLRVMKWFGNAATDEKIVSAYAANHVLPDQSASGIRTRRNELVELGVIRDSGKREKLRSGRYGVVWEVVPEAEREAPRRIKIKRDPKDVLGQVISLLDQVNPLWSTVLTLVGMVGLFFVMRKSILGPIIGLSIQFVWIAYAVDTAQLPFILSAFGYGGMNLYGIIRWQREKMRKNEETKVPFVES